MRDHRSHYPPRFTFLGADWLNFGNAIQFRYGRSGTDLRVAADFLNDPQKRIRMSESFSWGELEKASEEVNAKVISRVSLTDTWRSLVKIASNVVSALYRANDQVLSLHEDTADMLLRRAYMFPNPVVGFMKRGFSTGAVEQGDIHTCVIRYNSDGVFDVCIYWFGGVLASRARVKSATPPTFRNVHGRVAVRETPGGIAKDVRPTVICPVIDGEVTNELPEVYPEGFVKDVGEKPWQLEAGVEELSSNVRPDW